MFRISEEENDSMKTAIVPKPAHKHPPRRRRQWRDSKRRERSSPWAVDMSSDLYEAGFSPVHAKPAPRVHKQKASKSMKSKALDGIAGTTDPAGGAAIYAFRGSEPASTAASTPEPAPASTTPSVQPSTDFAHVVVLAVLLTLALASAGGGYATMYGVLSAVSGGWVPTLRALGPFALEAIAFHGAFACAMLPTVRKQMGTMRWVAILACLAVVGLCITTELVTSSSAAEVAERARVDWALSRPQAEAVQPAAPAVTDAPESEGLGAKYKHEVNNGKALDNQAAALAQQATRDEDARQTRKLQLENAKKTTTGEAWAPMLTAIVGALGGMTVSVLLELWLRATSGWLFGHRKERPGVTQLEAA
jgi:hypothetical protein